MDRSRLFAGLAQLAAAASGLLLVGVAGLAWRCEGSLERMFWIGQPLLIVRAPDAQTLVPRAGLALQIDFPEASQVAYETFRCELNGRDVTAQVTHVGKGGVSASLYPLRDGVNRLRMGVFGRGRFGIWVEDVVEVEVRARPLTLLDRA